MTENQVRRLDRNVRAAKGKLHAAIEALYTPGSYACYEYGVGHWVDCQVLAVSGNRIKVRGTLSGKEYWVYASRFYSTGS